MVHFLIRRRIRRVWLSHGLGMGWGEIKRAEAGENGNESARGTMGREKKRRDHFSTPPPASPRFCNFLVFSLFSPFSRRFPTEGASADERVQFSLSDKIKNLFSSRKPVSSFLSQPICFYNSDRFNLVCEFNVSFHSFHGELARIMVKLFRFCILFLTNHLR